MKLVTWNVNSIAARLPRVLEFLEQHQPDVLCMQETKARPESFPHGPLADVGYAAVDHSGGRWAGVAIAAPADLEILDVSTELPGNPVPEEARWIEATVSGVRVASVYVVNGRALDDPQYELKLDFLAALRDRCAEVGEEPFVVSGDFNVAPSDLDVYDPAAFEGATHVSAAERAALAGVLEAGMVDSFRELDAKGQGYTWWDYRGGHFHRGMGLRIDLVLASRSLAASLRTCGIDRDFRKGPKPSDHAPLIAEFEI